MLSFTVSGQPLPQGSKTMMKHRSTGRMIMLDDVKGLKPWRKEVTKAAHEAMGERIVIEGPVLLRCVFSLSRPKSHFGTGRNANIVKASAPKHPHTKGTYDLDKLVRAIGDSLTDAGVWLDDSQVVELYATKVYAGSVHLRALPTAGVWISVSPITNGVPS